jgi:hypothetical protein
VIHIQRRGDQPIDRAFRRSLLEFMEPCRIAGTQLEVRAPVYVPVRVDLSVTVQPGARPGLVKSSVYAALAGGSDGFFAANHFTFGQTVYRSQMVAQAMSVPGVAWVEVLTFRRLDSDRDVEAIDIGPLEIARLERLMVN